MDLLLVNMKLLGMHDGDLSMLPAYCEVVSRATGIPIPANYPVFGTDAFRTGTGVHAAAIIKARAKGDAWLVDRVYSGVPADWFGRHQEIEISHVSGMSNVKYWLEEHGYDADDEELCRLVFERAKTTDHVLSRAEIERICVDHGATPNGATR
jgi:2-isopropylmalate synthase